MCFLSLTLRHGLSYCKTLQESISVLSELLGNKYTESIFLFTCSCCHLNMLILKDILE